jgi:lipopolysaccharide heptosyltransferase II
LNILLIRLRLIGDVVFTTPLVRAVRDRYPSARLVYLVEPSAAPVMATNPHVSAVITVRHSRGWRRVVDDLKTARALRRERFDIVIDLHGGPRSAWFTWASRAPVRVGYDVPGRAWMYTRVVWRPREIRPRHSVENQWDLLTALDPAFGAHPDRSVHRTEMPVDSASAARLSDRLSGAGIGHGDTVVVLHVSAGNPFRRWPEASFAELAASLVGDSTSPWVLITSGPSDRHAVTRVLADGRARSGSRGHRLIDAEGLSLSDLRALMDRASLFVGGDSGPMHIASTSDVPIVALYGPTQPVRSGPWRPESVPTASVEIDDLPCRPCDQRVCATSDFRCLTRLTAPAVYQAARRLLEMPR